MEEVRQQGSPALPKLVRGFSSLSYQYKVYALDLLQAMGTEESRALLLDVACGRLAGGEDLTSRAAYRYFNAVPDKREVTHLSSAHSVEVREKVPLWLRQAGVRLDLDVLQAMEPFLQDPQVQVRSSAIYYVGSMEGHVLPEERARALIRSAITLETAKDIKRPMAYYDGAGERWTQLDLAVDEILRSLAHLLHAGNLTPEAILGLLPEPPGLARDCVFLALARGGNPTLRPEMRRIVLKSPVTKMRYWALQAYYRQWAREEDLPVLEQVATEDPHVIELTKLEKEALAMRRPPQTQDAELPNRLTPLRDLAQEIIVEVRRRAEPKAP